MKSNLGKSFLFFVYMLSAFTGYTQNKTIDSLNKVLQKQIDDTNKVNTLYALCEEFRYKERDYAKALKYAQDGISLSDKIAYKGGKGTGYFKLGQVNYSRGQYAAANKFFDSALNIFREINDKKNIAKTFLWTGDNYYDQGFYSDALNYYNKSLNLFIELGDKRKIAEIYLQMGYCYEKLDSYGDASTNMYKALKFFEEIGDKEQIANTLHVIGLNNMDFNDDSDALKNLQTGLKLRTELNIREDMAQSMTVLGFLYTRMGNYSEALKYDSASFKLFQELRTTAPWGIPIALDALGETYHNLAEKADASGDKDEASRDFNNALISFKGTLKFYEEIKNEGSVAIVNNELGFTFIKLKNYSAARSCFIKSLQLPANSGYNNVFRDSYLGLSQLDSTIGNYKEAYLNYKKYIIYRDSLVNEETSKKSLQAKMLYESEKNEAIAKAAELKRKAEEDAERSLQLTAIAVFIPIFFVGVLLLSRTKVRSRVVEFLGVLSLLLFFEFITDLIYPYVSRLTNENPIWEMLFLVSLAALLEPINFKLEQWVKGHLVHRPVHVPVPVVIEGISNEDESDG
jgi:tetratricopeptide (TPR) repeat protein